MKTQLSKTDLKIFSLTSGEGEMAISSWQPANIEIRTICKMDKQLIPIHDDSGNVTLVYDVALRPCDVCVLIQRDKELGRKTILNN